MELIKNNIKFYDLILDSSRTYEENTDAIVPDTFPDILRVASAVGSAQIKDESPQNDRLLISGMVKATVLYIPEDGEGIKKLDIPLNFAHIEEGKGITPSSETYTDCQVVSVDARVMNSRKLAVTATISLSNKVYAPKEITITSDAKYDDDLPLEILKSSQEISFPSIIKNKEFTIMEDIEIANAENIADILGSRAVLKVNDVKLMPGKIVLKGDADICNLTLGTDNSLRIISNTIPFTQIFDVDEISEDNNANVSFSISNLDCELREGGILSVGVGANALITVYNAQNITSISDAYQTQYPVTAETKSISVCGERFIGEISGEASENIPSGMKVVSVIDSSAVLDGFHFDDNCKATAMATVNVLFISDDNQPYIMKRSIPIVFDLQDCSGDRKAGDFKIKTTASPSGEDSVNVKIIAKGKLISNEKRVLSDLQSLSIDREHPKNPSNSASLVLRYINDTERLWDLAKNYNTTMDAIRQANKLSPEQASVSAQMLLIPIR